MRSVRVSSAKSGLTEGEGALAPQAEWSMVDELLMESMRGREVDIGRLILLGRKMQVLAKYTQIKARKDNPDRCLVAARVINPRPVGVNNNK